MAKKKTTTKSSPPPSFEEALAQLQTIVQALESGKLTLQDSLSQYEVGIGLLKQCYDSLDSVEQKIRLLVDVDEEGRARTQPFTHAATHPDSRSSAQPASRDTSRSRRRKEESLDQDDEEEFDEDDFDNDELEETDGGDRLF